LALVWLPALLADTREDLINAAANSDLAQVAQLIAAGAAVNDHGADGESL